MITKKDMSPAAVMLLEAQESLSILMMMPNSESDAKFWGFPTQEKRIQQQGELIQKINSHLHDYMCYITE